MKWSSRTGLLLGSTMSFICRSHDGTQQCSSTLIVVTSSNLVTSTMKMLRPRLSTPLHIVFQKLASFLAITLMLMWLKTTNFNTHRRAVGDCFDRLTQTLSGDCDQRLLPSGWVNVQMRTASVAVVSPISGSVWCGPVPGARSRRSLR